MSSNYNKYYKMLKKSRKAYNTMDSENDDITSQKRVEPEDKFNKPFGGFPPIVICSSIKNKLHDSKNREYSANKQAVSIKDIMQQRKDVKPFV